MRYWMLGCFVAAVAGATAAPVRDALTSAREADVRVGGRVGALQERFFRERVMSSSARETIWKEARDAFAHPDDDVYNKPAGMWKGEFWGKLMISACRVAASTGDEGLRRFLQDEAHRLMAFQRPDGYLGTYVNAEWVMGADTNETVRTMGWPCDYNWNLWCRKYTLWGLVACYQLTGDRTILAAAERSMSQEIDMLHRQGVRIADTGTTRMRGLPPCSTLKPLLLLYEETGTAKYLDFAREIYASWSDPTCRAPQFAAKLAEGLPLQEWYPRENGSWGKAYEMMSCLAGIVEYWRVTGDAGALRLAKDMRERILADEQNLCCSVGYNDQFWGAKRQLNGVSEPCDAIHWMRLNYELYLATGECKYVDEIERCFYNAFLAGVRPDGKWGARCVRSHGRHQEAPPQSGMTLQHCCVNNMPRGFMDAARTILAKDVQGVLQVGLYHDSEAAVGGDTVTVTGNYPVSDEVTVVIRRPVAGKVRFRVPDWCPALTLCSETACRRATKPGWFEVEAPAGKSEWHLDFDMNARIVDSHRASVSGYGKGNALRERWAGREDSDMFAYLRTTPAAQVFYGPLMLAKSVKLGADEKTILDPETVNGGGWRVTAKPSKADGVWGAWTLNFEKDGRKKSVKACDYSSAAVWGKTGVEFSVFF